MSGLPQRPILLKQWCLRLLQELLLPPHPATMVATMLAHNNALKTFFFILKILPFLFQNFFRTPHAQFRIVPAVLRIYCAIGCSMIKVYYVPVLMSMFIFYNKFAFFWHKCTSFKKISAFRGIIHYFCATDKPEYSKHIPLFSLYFPTFQAHIERFC